MRRLPLLALALALGCKAPAPDAAPMAGDPRLVAILPFADETGRSSFDGDEFGSILASEFVKATGARALRPAQLRTEAGGKIASITDAVRIARKLGADTILACAVTDYDPYDPPRIAVHVQLLRAEPRTLSTKELDVLLQSASWHKGPLPMTRDGARHAFAAFEEVFDARDASMRRRVEAYSPRSSEIYAVQPRWLQFVSNQIVLRAWEKHGS